MYRADMQHAKFIDRADAGRQLAVRLLPMALDRPVVYALPRGGVPVALEIARVLRAPLDLILVRKIGAPARMTPFSNAPERANWRNSSAAGLATSAAVGKSTRPGIRRSSSTTAWQPGRP